MRQLAAAGALAVLFWIAAGGVASASHEEMGEGRVADAQVSPDEGPPGTVIEVAGTCQFATDVPATNAYVDLSQRVEPWYGTSKNIPVGDDSKFAGELVVPIDAPADDGYRLSVTCLADDQAFGTHDFDFAVLPGGPNPNRIELAPEQGPPGTAIAIQGVCMFTADRPGDTASGYFAGGSPYRSVNWETPIDADGKFEGEVVVPDDATPGDYVVASHCVADGQSYANRFNDRPLAFVVTPAPPPSPTATTDPTDAADGQLPETGGPGIAALAGLAVLALAVVGLAVGRRRPARVPG